MSGLSANIESTQPDARRSLSHYVNDNFSYMSDPRLAASETPRLAVEELGMQLPKPVIDGVQAELADLRIAAKDIGRRITQYEADGRNARIA